MAQTKPEAKALAKFTISGDAGGYRLHIEDDGGDTLELTATAEQLDLIAETVDALLGDDDSADEVDGADEEDEIEDD
jgi:hypothetical protein